jgi:hypothetical protein
MGAKEGDMDVAMIAEAIEAARVRKIDTMNRAQLVTAINGARATRGQGPQTYWVLSETQLRTMLARMTRPAQKAEEVRV